MPPRPPGVDAPTVTGNVRRNHVREIGPPWIELIESAPSGHVPRGKTATARAGALANRGGVQENRCGFCTMWEVIPGSNGRQTALSFVRIAEGSLNVPDAIKGRIPPKMCMLFVEAQEREESGSRRSIQGGSGSVLRAQRPHPKDMALRLEGIDTNSQWHRAHRLGERRWEQVALLGDEFDA